MTGADALQTETGIVRCPFLCMQYSYLEQSSENLIRCFVAGGYRVRQGAPYNPLSLHELFQSHRDKHCSRSDKYCLRSKREELIR